ncbi:MAG: sigma-54 dependent transcriptional regulator [bacterium]|nr:sigma-54 dependent transcriptional regulator [bacterium]
MNTRILIVDDEPNIVSSFSDLLKDEGFRISGAGSIAEGERLLSGQWFDLVLLDLNFPESSGLELLQQIGRLPNGPAVIVISGQSEVGTAIEALKLGAADYLEKPVDPRRLTATVKNVVAWHNAKKQQRQMIEEIDGQSKLLGESQSMNRLRSLIDSAAPHDAAVLITGENGTGKELVATRLHLHSNRRDKPFIKVNCPGIPPALFESELFGHKKGSFTGAVKDYPGKFRLADGGTILLDEIGDLPRECQAKLLRALETGEIETIGAIELDIVDVRVICATNRDLNDAVKRGEFREDLYYRISVLSIEVPALRDRSSDIPFLAESFLHRFDPSGSTTLTPDAAAFLSRQQFPGNVRELRNLMERLTIFHRGARISISQLDVASQTENTNRSVNEKAGETKSLAESVNQYERQLIAFTLKQCDNNISRAARALKVDRANLSRKIKELGLRDRDQ